MSKVNLTLYKGLYGSSKRPFFGVQLNHGQITCYERDKIPFEVIELIKRAVVEGWELEFEFDDKDEE